MFQRKGEQIIVTLLIDRFISNQNGGKRYIKPGPGTRFAKLPIINGPGKPECCIIEASKV